MTTQQLINNANIHLDHMIAKLDWLMRRQLLDLKYGEGYCDRTMGEIIKEIENL